MLVERVFGAVGLPTADHIALELALDFVFLLAMSPDLGFVFIVFGNEGGASVANAIELLHEGLVFELELFFLVFEVDVADEEVCRLGAFFSLLVWTDFG